MRIYAGVSVLCHRSLGSPGVDVVRVASSGPKEPPRCIGRMKQLRLGRCRVAGTARFDGVGVGRG
jgi:hypothetical protein